MGWKTLESWLVVLFDHAGVVLVKKLGQVITELVHDIFRQS